MPRLGYACISQLTGRTTNHSCQLKSATPERLRALIEQNIADMRFILEHNLEHGWLLFRVGSSFIPFASHPVNTLRWWEEYAGPLRELGAFVRANRMHLSMHPGQYTVLNSPDENTRAAAVAELVYSARLFEAMELDAEHDLVLHIGGVYGDKPASSARFVEQALALPAMVRERLAVENEDRGYTLAEVLAVARQSGLAVIYDNLHDRLNPSPQPAEALLPEVFATWGGARGVPEVHFASQAEGARPGGHAEMADPVEFRAMLDRCGAVGEFDLMLEAKGKDAALQAVLADLGLNPVDMCL
jgi:UV DNA damage endonuclease